MTNAEEKGRREAGGAEARSFESVGPWVSAGAGLFNAT